MTNMRYLMGATIVAVLCSQSVGAEDLLQIYRQSLESDPVLKAAAASQKASQETKLQARALLLPNAGVTAAQGTTFGVVGSQAGQSSYDTHSYAISLVQPLYNRGSQVQQRLADATVGQADVDFLNAQNDLILRVAQGYFSVLAAIDNLTFATAEKNAFARQLEQANRRFEVGLATITDVYDAQSRFDGAVSSEISAVNTLANAREQLRQLTGQDYAQLNILGERMPLALPKPSDPEAWVRMALESNLSLQSVSFDVEQARENIKLQKSGHYPTLDLSVSRTDIDNGFTHTYGSQANLQLTIPLYSGGAVSSRSRQAAYNYEASRQSLENLQRDTIRTVRNAYRGQETAISQIKALDQTRVSTRSALEATQAGYEVGTRTIVDVLNAERDVYRAERDYAASRYSYVVNVLTLRQAAGRLTEEDVVEINGWLGASHPTSGIAATPSLERKTGQKNAAARSVTK
ncbi:MAG: TolC family outer membrane protein [Gammaproteobacteria bacterium]|nr:TolC family outer membrane protein [Gammaproteobacteria bacterium]